VAGLLAKNFQPPFLNRGIFQKKESAMEMVAFTNVKDYENG
jgi:hypothetical protein